MQADAQAQATLDVFQSDNDATLRRAQILSEMHFRNLRSKAKLVQETEKVSKQLEVSPPGGSAHRATIVAFSPANESQSNGEVRREVQR